MAEFEIKKSDIASLKDKVILATGGSSGIGLGAVNLSLQLGAKVAVGDLTPCPSGLEGQHNLTFAKVNVTDWKQLSALFKHTLEKYGRIDHVFANAGVTTRKTYLEDDVDENGDLLPPNFSVININLLGVVSTVKLAMHYLKEQAEGGSIVTSASVSSFTRFGAVDYSTAKAGVLGLTRSLHPHLHPRLPIRLNSIAPNWTETGLVPRAPIEDLGFGVNSPAQVAKAVAILMADERRHGELIFVDDGTYAEIEEPMLKAVGSFVGKAKAWGENWKAFEEFNRKMNSVLGLKV